MIASTSEPRVQPRLVYLTTITIYTDKGSYFAECTWATNAEKIPGVLWTRNYPTAAEAITEGARRLNEELARCLSAA